MCPIWTGSPFTATPRRRASSLISWHEGPRERVLHAEQDPDRLHAHGYLHGPGALPRPGSYRTPPRAAKRPRLDRLRGMRREYHSWVSPHLGRTMEFLWFGDRGYPVLLFPTSMGRF